MAQSLRGIPYYPTIVVLLVYLVVVQSFEEDGATGSSPAALRTPNTDNRDPIAPVYYQCKFNGWSCEQENKRFAAWPFAIVLSVVGEDLICPVLTTSSSAVIVQQNVTNASQVFMVDIPPEVPIDIVQKTGSCEGCRSLIIRAQSTDLPEEEFSVFNEDGVRVARICYGKCMYKDCIESHFQGLF